MAICPEGAISKDLLGAAETPFAVNSSKVIVAGAVEPFATAMPVETDPAAPDAPEASTYMRKAVPEFVGIPACETVAGPGLFVNTTSGTGTLFPEAGSTVIEPARSVPAPAVVSLKELRAATT